MTEAVGEACALPGLPAGGGLSWSWDLDLETLLTVLSEPAPWNHPPKGFVTAPGPVEADPQAESSVGSAVPAEPVPAEPVPVEPVPAGTDPVEPDPVEPDPVEADPVEAEFAEYLEAVESGRSWVVSLPEIAGRVAECLPAGPDLAGWLASSSVADLEDGALAGVVAAYRRLASWAQAGELAVVAQMASRSAAADGKIGADKDGRPARISDDACGQVSLALTMSQAAASWWTDLAVTLGWRLAKTGAALRTGQLDLSRARAIAEATAVLDDEAAREVEDRVLPKAEGQTVGQLRAALRRAVIAADPEGADRRREEAERRAKVTLYPDAEGTASLAGYNLPGVRATAAMARVTALARALKASGANGGIDFLRARVFLGLLLGTLPPVEPAADGQPDVGGSPQGGSPSGAGGSSGAGTPVEPECPSGGYCSSEDDWGDGGADLRSWPQIPAFLPPAPFAQGDLRPYGGGHLDLWLPWSTLIGESAEAGSLNRLGPITAGQARELACLAALDPAVEWRVVLTGSSGQVMAVAKIPRASSRAGPGGQSEDFGRLVRRVTVAVSVAELEEAELEEAELEEATNGAPDAGDLEGIGDLERIAVRIMAVARRLAEEAGRKAAADGAAEGGCAHTEATHAYRPPPRLHEFITTRDQTCRFPTCRQPSTRCDLDHTHPHDQGGPTCPCNLGPLCRHHHQLKQHPHWHLTQPTPGTFTWTTPTGRTYTARPALTRPDLAAA